MGWGDGARCCALSNGYDGLRRHSSDISRRSSCRCDALHQSERPVVRACDATGSSGMWRSYWQSSTALPSCAARLTLKRGETRRHIGTPSRVSAAMRWTHQKAAASDMRERVVRADQARPDGDLAVLQQQVGVCARIQRRSCVDKRGHQSLACHFQAFPGCGCNLLGTVVGIVYTQDQQHIWLRTR